MESVNVDNLVRKINAKYKELIDKNWISEENVKNHITKFFLEEMGYNLSECNFECNIVDKFLDLSIKVKKDEMFVVETKSANHKIIDKDITQLVNYLTSANISWGMLTNGQRYILVNNSIKSNRPQGTPEALLDKKVFDFDFANKNLNSEKYYLKYFSKENIFDNMTTNFYRDIAQFKSYKTFSNKKSWDMYKSTLYRFFDFYSEKKGRYYSAKANSCTELTQITIPDFFEFLDSKLKKDSTLKEFKSKESIKNNYSHISSMLKTLQDEEYISYHNFNVSKKDILNVYEETEKIKNINYLTEENIEIILEYIYNTKNPYRNLAIFTLCAYYGLERSEVHNLKWENINLDKDFIVCNNRQLNNICPLLKKSLLKLQQEKKENKIKSEYIFMVYYSGKYSHCKQEVINAVFSCLSDIDTTNEMWKMFSPNYVRKYLVLSLFKSGYSIEQIIYLIDIETKNIENYIPRTTILSQGEKKTKKKIINVKHPFEDVFNKFYEKIQNE